MKEGGSDLLQDERIHREKLKMKGERIMNLVGEI